MRSSLLSPKTVRRAGALAGTAGLLTLLQPHLANVWPTGRSDVADRIARMQTDLPTDLADGSILEGVEFSGTRLTLRLQVDDRLDLTTIRDRGRDEKCDAWGGALRSREIASVEYRYRQAGATASLFLDRAVCG